MTGYLGDIAALMICLVFAYFMGSLLGAWRTYPWPPGGDTINHLYKTLYILKYWPHQEWNFQWAGGMPQFLWYPPLYYYFVALIVLATNQSVELATVISLAAGFCFFTIGCYGFLRKVTGDKCVSTTCTILTASSPAIWAAYTTGGVLSRQASLSLMPFSFWMLAEYVDDLRNNRPTNLSFSLLVLSLAASVPLHPFFGAITITLSLVTLLAVVEGLGEKIRSVVRIILPVGFLNVFFLVPYIFTGGMQGTYPGKSLETFFQTWSAPNLLLPLPRNVSHDVSLNWVMVPLSAALVVLALLKRRSEIPWNKLAKIFLVFIFLMIGFVALAPIAKFDMTMIALTMATLPFFLASFDAIVLARLVPIHARFKRVLSVILVCLVIMSTVAAFSVNPANLGSILTPATTPAEKTLPFVIDETTMFRVGVSGTDGYLGQFFNYVTDTPQTRDYQSAAVLQPDWHAWLMHGVWTEQGNYPETDFLLDWWSVKWVLVDINKHDPTKFLNEPQRYKLVANTTLHGVHYYEFLYESVTPIIAARNQPTLLVIGKDQYRSTLNVLSYSGYDSKRLIPIHGHEYVDDYSLDELKKFDAILLIGHQYHDRTRSWDLLRRYVEAGGGLIFETGLQYLNDDWNAPSFPDPSPITQTTWGNFGKQWEFSYTPSEISENIKFDSFSPPISGQDPWSYSRSSNEAVRPWAKPVLLNYGQPMVVAGQFGKGRVIWTGMNLYFHINVYKNQEEIKFAAKMIDWVTRAREQSIDVASYTAERVNPERVEVKIDSPSKGALYKEFYFENVENWRASVVEGNGKTQELDIYRAGPDFMYVVVPQDVVYPIKVVFEYNTVFDYVTLIVSIAALVLIVGYAILGDRFKRLRVFQWRLPSIEWLETEEE